MGRLRRRTGARNCQQVAAGYDGDPELPLNAIEMLIALAVQQGEQQVVVEFQLCAPFAKFSGDNLGRDRGHCETASASEPDRLLALAPDISTGTISPIWSAAAATCTLWR